MWLRFDGLVNARDVGGIPTIEGGRITPRRLLRSDHLQELTDADLDRLHDLGVTDVVDLRSGPERRAGGPGPVERLEGITVHHHSLFAEAPTDGAGQQNGRAGDTLPWVGLAPSVTHDDPYASHYLSYLQDRPDSVVAALRTIATARGATLVHCAAGKDRTGTITALALLVAGASPDAVIADYAASSERMQQIVDKLMRSATYAENLRDRPLSSHLTRPETMAAFLAHITAEYETVPAMLGGLGWTPTDTEALRHKLTDP